MSKLTTPVVQAFLNERAEHGNLRNGGPLSAKSIKNMRVVLAACCKRAVAEGYMAANPVEATVYKHCTTKRVEVMTDANQRVLEEWLFKDMSLQNAGVILGLYSGMRLGEVCAIRWRHYDFMSGRIRVEETLRRISKFDEDLEYGKRTEMVFSAAKTNASNRELFLPDVLQELMVVQYERYELCGLNINSWHHLDDLSWLEIERQYYQKRGEPPIMQTMLASANQYRKVVCTDVVAWILARQIRRRKMEGANGQDALFTKNGERLQPQFLKKREEFLLDQVMVAGMHIAIEAQGYVHRESRDRARTDLFRGTAIYNYLYTAGMTQSQVALMCGIDRIHTYATFYTDWNHLEVMRYMKRQISVWHDEVFQIEKRGKAITPHMTPGGCDVIVVHGKAAPKAFMTLRASCGMEGCIIEIHGEGEDGHVKEESKE